ncbi:hypothetical protein DPMN_085268 [Dreissena polymorpha]|uniref:Uncharacterized protein n=1 Tax=Dreissena polymorpha TaxID=45954 RepID=A0A9D3YCC5_DREPO|nr:hypothetical protein DPMN_085268 [Dreissena polymorpha]
MDTLQERAMLSVSALVHSVCRTNQNCENFIEVKKIISLLENKIATSCKIEGDMRTVSHFLLLFFKLNELSLYT